MFLKDLLSNDHPLFTTNLQQLERAAGSPGIDTRLVADITHSAHVIMRSLGLDPADTTGEELYAALNSVVAHGNVTEVLNTADFVLLNLGDGPISFNSQDVIENAHHELPYMQRHVANAQRHLRAEIIRRYSEHDRTHNDLVHQLAAEIGLKPSRDEDYPAASPADTPYILAVGDIFTDAFIKLREDKARIDTDPDGSKRLSMEFGSKPPYEQADIIQAVGPSPNAAVAFSRLGVKAGLMAWLGDDMPGKDSLVYLRKEGINTDMVSVQKGVKSNYYYVLRYGAERTILVKNEAYNYAWQEPTKTPDWLYLSLISNTSWQLHLDMLAYLDEHPEIRLVFQPGTFHFEWGVAKLRAIYDRTHLLVLNREEAALVTGKKVADLRELANGLHDLGPEIVIITDGPAGAYASQNGKILNIPNYPDPAPPYDRTGAGDAFASTIVAALALGEPLETALRWAPINSMSVVQQLGAQAGLLHRPELEEWLSKAPAEFRTEELE